MSSSHFDTIATAYDESLPAHVVEHYLAKRTAFVLANCPPGEGLDAVSYTHLTLPTTPYV